MEEDTGEYIWKTSDGLYIKIKDMTTPHIINCLIGLKEGRIKPVKKIFLEHEGDDIEFEYIDNTYTCMEHFKRELKKRGFENEKDIEEYWKGCFDRAVRKIEKLEININKLINYIAVRENKDYEEVRKEFDI